MQLVKWNPWGEMHSLQRHFNSVWDNVFYDGGTDIHQGKKESWMPAVDIFENETHFTIKAELPGIEKDDMAVDLKDRVLSLRGERRDDRPEEKDKAHRRERSFGRFERFFTLPADVDAEKITAEYKDGLLTIQVPKPAKSQPRRITVH